MTLDPVHVDGIAQLAGRISRGVDTRDHDDVARTVWDRFLDPLVADELAVIEPLGDRRRRSVAIEDAALAAAPFETQHGLDAGTINPTTFTNGLVLDVAQAAMSAIPTDLDLHRARTIVATVHTNDATVHVEEGEWTKFDAGYSRQRIIQAPRVDRFEQQVVHVLALYLAESEHALEHADVVSDLLVLDGPLYPRGLLEWKGRDLRLERLLGDAGRPRDVVANYLRLVEQFVERDVPLCGFVKSPAARAITRAVRSNRGNAPWVDDAAFFKAVLDPNRAGHAGADGAAPSDVLTATNWFVSRGGVDRVFSVAGDVLGLDRRLAPADYEVAFCMLYDPRDDQLFRLETPAAFARDADRREQLLRAALKGIAVEGGPPTAVARADELARISREEKAALGRALERTFDARREQSYDTLRWGHVEAG